MFAFVGASFEHATKMALHINYARCTRWFQLQEFHLKSNKMYELNYWKKSITHKKTQSKRSQLIKFMYWAHFIPVKEIIRIYACGFCLFQQFHSLVYFGFFCRHRYLFCARTYLVVAGPVKYSIFCVLAENLQLWINT